MIIVIKHGGYFVIMRGLFLSLHVRVLKSLYRTELGFFFLVGRLRSRCETNRLEP